MSPETPQRETGNGSWVTVSRFHAFFKRDGAGMFTLQDAGSTSGTASNGERVPAQGRGSAVQVKSGDNLRFGSLELTFLSVSALRDCIFEFE